MNFFRYFQVIFKLSPVVFVINLATITFQAFFEVLAIVALTPLIDLFIKNENISTSQITEKFSSVMSLFGLTPNLKTYVLIFIVLTLLKSAAGLLFKYVSLRTKYIFLKQLMCGSFNKFFAGGMPFFQSEKQGVLVNTFNGEITTVGNSLSTMSLFLANTIRLCFYVVVPFSISWELTIIAGIVFGVIIIPSKLSDQLSYMKAKENVATANKLNIALQESLSAVKVILAFGNKEKAKREYESAFEQHRSVTIPFQMISSFLNAIFEPLFVAVLFFILYLSQTFYKIPFSEVVIILYTFRSMTPLILSMVVDKNYIFGFIPSYEQIERLQAKANASEQVDGTIKFESLKKSIELKNVTFKYDHKPVLQSLNLTIQKGEKVAFVGKSGAGKTTAIDLILGLYSVNEGNVLIDDVNLSDFKIDTFRQRIGYVPQDPILFNRSLRENLEWAKNEVSDNELIEVCKMSNSYEFVKSLPEGFDTQMGERGTRLSGGQRQRIALSRALVRKPDLLILDEATSALDNQSESLIQEAIENLKNDITVIVIAHRLSTIKNVDKIFVFDHGGVIESGTYDQLISKNEHFAQMVLKSNL